MSKQIIITVGENGRGVVFGTVKEDPQPGQPVTLTDARMVLYWSGECGGLFGLAAGGPKRGTRLTAPVASTTVTQWKETISVSRKAAKALEEWPDA